MLITIPVKRNKMKTGAFLVLLLALALTGPVSAQESVWSGWDPEVLQKASTAKDASYLTEEEKMVITLMNLARIDGEKFGQTFVYEWVKMNGEEKSPFVKSLYRDLKKTSGLPLLYPEEDLSMIAKGHAERSGKTGHVGHRDFEKRFKPVLGNPYNKVGENCSYGFNTATEVVVTLLIDEGIKDLGHRRNILNPGFNSAGVAFYPHKTYRYNCVSDFGSKIR